MGHLCCLVPCCSLWMVMALYCQLGRDCEQKLLLEIENLSTHLKGWFSFAFFLFFEDVGKWSNSTDKWNVFLYFKKRFLDHVFTSSFSPRSVSAKHLNELSQTHIIKKGKCENSAWQFFQFRLNDSPKKHIKFAPFISWCSECINFLTCSWSYALIMRVQAANRQYLTERMKFPFHSCLCKSKSPFLDWLKEGSIFQS